LDNDKTAQKFTKQALDLNKEKFKDERGLYQKFNISMIRFEYKPVLREPDELKTLVFFWSANGWLWEINLSRFFLSGHIKDSSRYAAIR
jgi:hypothetical protein